MFELVEEAFDEVALAVNALWHTALNFSVALGWDVGTNSSALGEVDEGLGIIAAVGDEIAGPAQARDQWNGGLLVGGLAGCQRQADGQSGPVDDDVDLGAQSSTRTADGVIRAPFFPPAACWWARMIELSISAMD